MVATATFVLTTSVSKFNLVEGVQYVKLNPNRTPDILGIISQLRKENLNWEARFVSRYILAHQNRYDARVIKVADQIVNRRKAKSHQVSTLGELSHYFGGLRTGTVLKLSFREQPARQGALTLQFLGENGTIVLDRGMEMLLMAVVASGYWDGERNQSQTVTTTEKFDACIVAHRLYPVLDKVEIVSTPERSPSHLEVEYQELLKHHPDVWFEREIFEGLCDEWGAEKSRLAFLSTEPTLEEALEIFWGSTERNEFLREYVEKFLSAVGG